MLAIALAMAANFLVFGLSSLVFWPWVFGTLAFVVSFSFREFKLEVQHVAYSPPRSSESEPRAVATGQELNLN